MTNVPIPTRLVLGAGYFCAVLNRDAELVRSYESTFTYEELMEGLLPCAIALATKYGEHHGWSAGEVGDRMLEYAHMAKQSVEGHKFT